MKILKCKACGTPFEFDDNIEVFECTVCGMKQAHLPDDWNLSYPVLLCDADRYYAYKGCTDLERIIINEGVTEIGIGTFSECINLTSATIPDSVTEIGLGAFRGCTNLTSVTIPDGVTEIGSNAFSDCPNLKYNIYDNGCYLGNDDNPYIILIKGKDVSITSCTVHPNTKFIHSDAFRKCTRLKNIVIDKEITTIGRYAFDGCTSLTTVIIPDSVTTIGVNAFRNCAGLTSVTIGNGVKVITHSMFQNCSSLTDVIIPDGVTTIGVKAFYNCTNLANITIPDSVTAIGCNAFGGCTSLTAATFENESEWSLQTTVKLIDPATAAKDLSSKYPELPWLKKQ